MPLLPSSLISMSFNHPSHQMGSDTSNDELQHNSIIRPPSSSSRWIPPTKVHLHQPPPHPLPAADSTSMRFSGNDRYMQHQDRENNYRLGEQGGRDSGFGSGGGRQGGGKVVRQRRHGSSDTHHQRNLHRRPLPPPPPYKKIITPTEITAASCTTISTTTESTSANNDDTPKLNPSIPAEARRINQRLRQVLFGKNTVGYEEYTKKVPKHQRKPRSLECPMTPDHRADIPTKRWQGLLNAWRRALHQYDPADLHLRQQQPSSTSITLAPRPCSTEEDVQSEEIAQAKASGLQVAFGSMNVGEEARLFATKVAPDDNDNEVMMMIMKMKNADACIRRSGGGGGIDDIHDNGQTSTMNDVSYFDEEAAYQKAMMIGGAGGDADLLEECESDSDDDIL